MIHGSDASSSVCQHFWEGISFIQSHNKLCIYLGRFCAQFPLGVSKIHPPCLLWNDAVSCRQRNGWMWFSLGAEAGSESPGEVWSGSVQGEAVSHTLTRSFSKGTSVKLSLMTNIGMQLNVTGEQGILYQMYRMNANGFLGSKWESITGYKSLNLWFVHLKLQTIK